MAQVEPAYRRFADRARAQYNAAVKRGDRPELIQFLREDTEAWGLIDNVLTMIQLTTKSLATSDRAADMMQMMASNAIYNRQLIPPADD